MIYRVECYSGYKYGERPTAVLSEENRYEITQILREWKSPTAYFFQVLTADEQAFELKFESDCDEWSVRVI